MSLELQSQVCDDNKNPQRTQETGILSIVSFLILIWLYNVHFSMIRDNTVLDKKLK